MFLFRPLIAILPCGSWHAPWLPKETGEHGWRALRRVAEELDPHGVLNPHVLLDRTDRLEE